MKLNLLRLIARAVVSKELEHRVPKLVGVGKGDGNVDSNFPLVSKVQCAKIHQDRNVGQHRILQLEQFF